MAIPGIGPLVAAGWLATTLAGAGAGAVAGGLVGALTGAGVSREEAEVYEEGVRRGHTLVSVRADETDIPRIEAILDRQLQVIARTITIQSPYCLADDAGVLLDLVTRLSASTDFVAGDKNADKQRENRRRADLETPAHPSLGRALMRQF